MNKSAMAKGQADHPAEGQFRQVPPAAPNRWRNQCRHLGTVSAAALWLVGGCSSTQASHLRPDAPTFSGAMQTESCSLGEGRAEPYVVDWPADRRGELEVSLSQKIAVVSYDCDKLRVLRECEMDGSYSFVGFTEKEQVLRLENADEIRANLPLAGGALSAKLGAELERGSTLDVALALVGRKSTPTNNVFASDLRGDCSQATHFVRSATLGAFAIKVGTRAKTSTAAEIFGAGVAGASASSRVTESRDGRLDACREASPQADKPASHCGAPVRLELKAIRSDKSGPVAEATGDEPTPTCPKNTVPSDGGKCARPSPTQPHLCQSGDAVDCTAQCDRGSMGSCAILGRMYQVGNRVPRDIARAAPLFDRACKGGATPACGRIGELLLGTPKEEGGKKLLQQSCSAGWFTACTILGNHIANTKGASKVNVFDVLKRSCAGGDPEGCWNIGFLFEQGQGVRQNDAEAVRYFQIACSGGAKHGCQSYAKALDQGKGVAQDTSRAVTVLRNACDHGYSHSCSPLSDFYFAGRGVAKDVREGVALQTRACEGADRGTCMVLAMRYWTGTGIDVDEAKARRYMDRACEAGIGPACTTATEWREKK